MPAVSFKCAFVSLGLAAATLVGCGVAHQGDGLMDAAPEHLAQAMKGLAPSPLASLQTTSRLLESLARGRGDLGDADELHALHSQYIARFWQVWHRDALASMQDAADVPEDLGDARNAATREMQLLSALFQDPMPARGRTLLYVLGDTLISLSDRLAASVALYDFSCKLTDCHQNNEASEFQSMVKLLAALPDADALRALLSDSDAIIELRPEWRNIFASAADPLRHRVLEDAVLQATGEAAYTPTLMRSVSGVPASMTMLSAVMLRCQRWNSNFERFGYFENHARPRLSVPLNHERLAEWGQEVKRQLDDLSAVHANLFANRHGVNGAQQRGNQQAREQLAVETKLKQVRLQIAKTVGELHGLRADITRTEMGQTFAQNLGVLLDGGHLDMGAEMQVGSTVRAAVSPGHAQPGIARDIRSWALPQHVLKPLAVQRGNVVALSAQGTWSPTCALRMGRPQAAGASAGPEGFDEQLIDGNARMTSVVSSFDTSLSASTSTSLDVGVEAFAQMGGSFFGNEAGIRGSAKLTSHSEAGCRWSQRNSTDDVTSVERRTAASFSVGLRLPNTPFPLFPAGSLLLALQPSDTARDTIFEVVRPQMSYIVPETGTLWFVVNDRADPACNLTGAQRHLDLQVRVARPISAAAKQLGEVMAAVITDLDERLTAAVDLQPTPLLTASVRSELIAALNKNGVRLEDLPPAFANLFQGFVDKALASWERKITVADRQRDLQSLMLEEASILQDLALGQAQRRLNGLALVWSANEVDVDALRWRTTRLMRFASETLVPALRIIYPERLALMRQQVQPVARHLAKLRDLPFNHDFGSLALSAKEIISALHDELRAAQATARTPGRAGMALTFARPGRETFFESPRADSARARALWRAVENGTEATVALRPEDVYSSYFDAPETMRCSHCAPIVRFMGGYFIVPAGVADPRSFNASSHPLQTVVNSDVLFATRHAASTYTFAGATLTIPIKIGEDAHVRAESVWRDQSGHGNNEAVGLSPFANFTFKFKHAGADSSEFLRVLKEATAFVLLVDVETQPCNTDSLGWLETCR